MERNFSPLPLLHQSPAFFSSSNVGNVRSRKRAREAEDVAPTPQQQQHCFFSLQSPAEIQVGFLPPAMLGLAPLVSTGLRLAFDEQKQNWNQREQRIPLCSTFFSEELGSSSQINQQKEEFEEFLMTQGEQLRREIVERRQRLYRCLVAAAEETMERKLREKAAEAELAVRRNAELEDRLNHLRSESMAWQSKALAEQAAADALHVELQQAAAAEALTGGECCGESRVGDVESAYVDPDRPETLDRPCRSCQRRPSSVVLLPCRHLCLCAACDSAGAVGVGCPACGCFRTGSLQVSLS